MATSKILKLIDDHREQIKFDASKTPDTPLLITDAEREWYNQIRESIKFSRQLQNFLVSDKILLSKLFSESFIFDKPKNEVSGDFYWYTKIDNKVIFAIVDCSGHGISGALISVLGISLLNQIVKEEKKTDPSQILQLLNERFKRSFHYNELSSIHHSSMDICLTSIDYDTHTLTFAGAKRPLFVIQNQKLLTLQGSSFSIGGYDFVKNKIYQNDTIDFKKGDKVYLFSDGYPDQFGGPDNKRLSIKFFRELLQIIHHLPMQEQMYELEKAFTEWSSDMEQTDDILIAGLNL